MIDPLQMLWPLVDAPDSIVAAHVVATWPAGVHQQLIDLGVLRPGEDAQFVLCPECGEHVEEVLAFAGPGGRTRYAIPCHVTLRADVSPEARRQWMVDFAALTAELARILALTGQCSELLPSRLWRLGRTNWQGASRDVLFARGLDWDDGPTVRATLVRSRKPIVFVPLRRPPEGFWRTVPPTLMLSHVASLVGGHIEVETLEIAAAIHDADALAASGPMPALSIEDLKRMIRQQVKAELKSALNDDAFLAAYRLCGSVRDAATFLSQETEGEVSKDKVQRALGRAGGAAAVLNSKNSASVVRGAASQPRDKHGKAIAEAQPAVTEDVE